VRSPQYRITADRVAEGGAHEHVGGEVGGERDTGEPDGGGRAVSDIGKPAVTRIAAGDDGGYGESGGGVSGREAAPAAEPVVASGLEPSVGEAAAEGDVAGPQAAGGALEHDGHDGGVGNGYAGQQGGLLLVGIPAGQAEGVEGSGDGQCGPMGVAAAEGAVEAVEGGGVAEVGGVVRIGGDESGGDAGGCGEGLPAVVMADAQRVGPNAFLIAEDRGHGLGPS